MNSSSTAKSEPIRRLRRLFLWLNYGCNAKCLMCDIWKERPGERITAEQVSRWSAEWADIGLESVIICGESLLHPELFEIFRILDGRGMRIELLTNGILLHRHAEGVLRWCASVRTSLDGPRDVHNRTRGVAGIYDALARGVGRVLEARPDFDIKGRCAIHALNYRLLPETVAAAKEIGLKGISFSALDVDNAEAFRRLEGIGESRRRDLGVWGPMVEDLEARLREFFTVCADDFSSGYIQDTPGQLWRNVYDHYACGNGVTAGEPVVCDAPWTSAIIEPDGGVRPCFPMPTVGSMLGGDSLLAVLNGDEARSLRAGLDVSRDKTCRDCVCRSTPECP